jgi:hypothetical protein
LDGSVVQDVVQHKDAYVIKPSNLFEGKWAYRLCRYWC